MTHFARPPSVFRAGSRTTSAAANPSADTAPSTAAELGRNASTAVSLTVALRYMAEQRSREALAAALKPALNLL